jgi:acetylornithine deacetylase
MKSFFALAAAAIADLESPRWRAPLIIVATADEESTMSGARALAGGGEPPRARCALIGEPTNLRPARLHKGILMERIVVTGRSGHSSNPQLGASALEGMHRVVAALLEWRTVLATQYHDERFVVSQPTLNFGRIAGGDNPNRICARCELDIDLRCLPGMELPTLRRKLQECAARALQGSDLEVTFETLHDGVPPMDTSPTAEIVRAAEQLTGVAAGTLAFATEAPFLAQLGAEVVVLGAGSIDNAHRPDEYLESHQIPVMIGHLKAFIRRFCLD